MQYTPKLKDLMQGPTTIQYNPTMEIPNYWEGYDFHRTTGSWDGHEHMGFIHGELVHRWMVNKAFAGIVLKVRQATAGLAFDLNDPNIKLPQKILDMGCGSAQYTMGLATTYPDAEIWGCDISAKQLEQAQRKANEKNCRFF